MKTNLFVLVCMLTLSAPLVMAQPGHNLRSANKGIRATAPADVERPYGRPGDLSKATRFVRLDMNDQMRFYPADVKVKQGETINFLIKNSTKTSQVMALGSATELTERAAMLKQFPKTEMSPLNQVHVKSGESAEMLWQFTKAGAFAFASTSQSPLEAGMMVKIVVTAD